MTLSSQTRADLRAMLGNLCGLAFLAGVVWYFGIGPVIEFIAGFAIVCVGLLLLSALVQFGSGGR